MTNTDIKIRLEKILVRNEQRTANKLIPADVLDIKDIIKQLSICGVVKSFYCYNGCSGKGQCKSICDSCKNVEKLTQ